VTWCREADDIYAAMYLSAAATSTAQPCDQAVSVPRWALARVVRPLPVCSSKPLHLELVPPMVRSSQLPACLECSWPRHANLSLAIDPAAMPEQATVPYLACDRSPRRNHLLLFNVSREARACSGGDHSLVLAGNSNSFAYRSSLAPGSLSDGSYTCGSRRQL
jgi:hypothetical protein